MRNKEREKRRERQRERRGEKRRETQSDLIGWSGNGEKKLQKR